MDFCNIFVMFKVSQISLAEPCSIPPKYLHLSAVPDNLRGGDQRCLSSKSDTCYLFRIHFKANLKILQFLKSKNFLMQVIWLIEFI